VQSLIEAESPLETSKREITEETGISSLALVRTGDPLVVEDEPHVWTIHPFLFETDTRTVTLNKEHEAYRWTSPSDIPRVRTVPCLWESYQRVAPTVESIKTDTVHGSTYLSIRALEVLRDTATNVATTNSNPALVTETATDLLHARPSMTAVTNRINQVMTDTNDDPAMIEAACEHAIERAYSVNETAATNARNEIRDQRVLIHSRSGTVIAAIAESDARVVITESHPGDEGRAVAEELATEEYEVTLIADAGTAHVLHECDIDTVLVGADTILADGSVFNKIGTRTIALAARAEKVPLYVVASTDKIKPGQTTQNETGERSELYNGSKTISVYTPRFDTTPASCITGYITEDGLLSKDEIQSIAARHRRQRSWQDTTPSDNSE
jgi:translation initiation factor 2B subunit (eIF-2B alpha/beta/delta family)